MMRRWADVLGHGHMAFMGQLESTAVQLACSVQEHQHVHLSASWHSIMLIEEAARTVILQLATQLLVVERVNPMRGVLRDRETGAAS